MPRAASATSASRVQADRDALVKRCRLLEDHNASLKRQASELERKWREAANVLHRIETRIGRSDPSGVLTDRCQALTLRCKELKGALAASKGESATLQGRVSYLEAALDEWSLRAGVGPQSTLHVERMAQLRCERDDLSAKLLNEIAKSSGAEQTAKALAQDGARQSSRIAELEGALGTARAQANAAQSERAALDDRLRKLAEEQSALQAERSALRATVHDLKEQVAAQKKSRRALLEDLRGLKELDRAQKERIRALERKADAEGGATAHPRDKRTVT
ncbi:unnamed protein product (mitochondrion) [Plasmodiophora brassicae]|uniref:Uncharacterized protein n=1 Tax=Plasmodiophora brassicae TaxID=37360 RepID=A0A3P3Y7S1_PLABS|nr:unnamed protein product [Plasmodiophora brassicae]